MAKSERPTDVPLLEADEDLAGRGSADRCEGPEGPLTLDDYDRQLDGATDGVWTRRRIDCFREFSGEKFFDASEVYE